MKLVFDLSSVMWTCLSVSVGVDPEGEKLENSAGKLVQVNTAMYGYEASVNHINSVMAEFSVTPCDCIFVVEGLNSKARRLMIDKDYKASRGQRPDRAYVEFQNLRELLTKQYKALGTICVKQNGVEADDVIAWLAENTKENIVIVSNDNDLAVLQGVNQHGAAVATRIGGELNYNKYGAFAPKYISLYKAMVGDSSDNIKGIPGFGPAAWLELDKRFGAAGMDLLIHLCETNTLQTLEADAETDKFVRKIFDERAAFLKSYKLAKLHPEWVDTMQEALEWLPGMVNKLSVPDERLRKWEARRHLITKDRFEAFVPWFKEQIKFRSDISLDIETSTPDESDEWLAAQGNPDGVDVIGSELTGMSLTFGVNYQQTVYLPVDHYNTNNVSKDDIFQLLQIIAEQGLEIVIQNVSFEGTVLYHEFGARWKDNGYEGMLPNWLDTKFEANYVNENEKSGLKYRAKLHLGYDQVEYKDTVTIDWPEAEDGSVDVGYPGGRNLGRVSKSVTPGLGQEPVTQYYHRVMYKMRELPATHVFSYTTDDTIVTCALHNFYKLFLTLEGSYEVYKLAEIKASYLHTQSFVHGTKISLSKLKAIEAEDDAAYEQAWAVVRQYLIEQGWEGTVTPVFDKLEAMQIKQAYEIVVGEPLKTQIRTPAKVIALFEDQQKLLAGCCKEALAGDFSGLNSLVARHFKGEPDFNIGSPAQKAHLFYEVMQLPVVVTNKVTDAARARGETEGTPKTDNLAIAYALETATEAQAAVLKALRVMQMVQTRKGLYYKPYPYFVHWKTGRVHSSHNQCSTNTRRASSSSPNTQQVSKHEKVEGYSPKVREVYVPHKPNAVIVSMDFKAQELRVIADYSRDENMLSCYIGDKKKDLHALTGLGIFNRKHNLNYDYEQFEATLANTEAELFGKAKKARGAGKTTNFTTEFGAAAPKLAQVLMITPEEAQIYIDAKAAAMPQVAAWKDSVIAEARQTGKVRTKLGAVRHLRELLLSEDRYIASKAERQAVNFKVQSSSAEMTKLAEGRMWDARLEQRFDCEIIGPIHDEVVSSVVVEDLYEFCVAKHACMAQPYADMFVPIESSISFGPNFGQQVEVGDTVAAEDFERGLAQVAKMREAA